jgi:hypothetical protein
VASVAFVVCLAVLGYTLLYSDKTVKWLSYINKGIFFCFFIVAGFMANFLILTDYSFYNANALNFSAVVYPIIQVYYGNALFINFYNQYGAYAQFLEPIFYLTSGISITKITAVLAILLFIGLSSLGLFLYFVLKNKALALVSFIGLIYFQFFAGTLWPYELYYQYFPIRTLFPSLCLLLSFFYFSKPSRKFYYFQIIFFSFSVLWNLDVGLFCIGSFLAALCFSEALKEGQKDTIKKIAFHIFNVLLGVIITFSSFFLYLFARYGKFPDISWFTYYQSIYVGGGLSTLVLNRLWVLIFIIYVGGLVYSTIKFKQKEFSVWNILVFQVSLLGVGIFSYHLRSTSTHDSTLAVSGYPAFILLAMVADSVSLWPHKKEIGWKQKLSKLFKVTPYIILIFIVSFLCVAFFYNISTDNNVHFASKIQDFNDPLGNAYKPLWQDGTGYRLMGELAGANPPVPPWEKKARFFSKYSNPNGSILQDIFVISDWDYYIYLKVKARTSAPIMNFRHLWGEKQTNGVVNEIVNKKFQYIFLDSDEITQIDLTLGQYRPINISLNANYEIIDSTDIGNSWHAASGKWYPNMLYVYKPKE